MREQDCQKWYRGPGSWVGRHISSLRSRQVQVKLCCLELCQKVNVRTIHWVSYFVFQGMFLLEASLFCHWNIDVHVFLSFQRRQKLHEIWELKGFQRIAWLLLTREMYAVNRVERKAHVRVLWNAKRRLSYFKNINRSIKFCISCAGKCTSRECAARGITYWEVIRQFLKQIVLI